MPEQGQTEPAAFAHSRALKVVGGVPALPLDIAANAGPLIFGDRMSGQNGFQSRTEVGASDGAAVARPAVIELASVDERPVAVE